MKRMFPCTVLEPAENLQLHVLSSDSVKPQSNFEYFLCVSLLAPLISSLCAQSSAFTATGHIPSLY